MSLCSTTLICSRHRDSDCHRRPVTVARCHRITTSKHLRSDVRTCRISFLLRESAQSNLSSIAVTDGPTYVLPSARSLASLPRSRHSQQTPCDVALDFYVDIVSCGCDLPIATSFNVTACRARPVRYSLGRRLPDDGCACTRDALWRVCT